MTSKRKTHKQLLMHNNQFNKPVQKLASQEHLHRYKKLAIIVNHKKHKFDIELYNQDLFLSKFFNDIPEKDLQLFIGKWSNEYEITKTINDHLDYFKQDDN